MIMNIIASIKESIKRKITFHKRVMFVGSLYGCLVNKKQEQFIDDTIDKLIPNNELSTLSIKAIKKEMKYILSKDMTFNPATLGDINTYNTKVINKVANEITQYFKNNPISTELNNEIESRYVDATITKPELVQRELVTLVHGMNINVSGSTTKVPLALYTFLWDYRAFGIVMEGADDVDTVVNNILTVSPFKLWYDSAENVRKDIKKIITFVKDNL